jgi:hypothetical protein
MLTRHSDVPFIIFTDETSFWLNKSRPSKAWVTIDSVNVNMGKTRTHGPKVHLWGPITSRGTISLHLFEENLTGEGYVKIFKNKNKSFKTEIS